MIATFSLGLTTFAALAATAFAGGFEQPYFNAPDPGSPSSFDGQQTADEFILPQPVGTTDIWWYGSFASGDPFDTFGLMQFRLRFFQDSGGEPAPVPFRDLAFIIAGANPTGMQDSEGRAVYRFLAIDWNLDLPANERLYISILEEDPDFAPGDFRWSNSFTDSNDVNWLRNADADPWQTIGGFRGQSAFGIGVPAPHALAALTLAGFIARRTRHRDS